MPLLSTIMKLTWILFGASAGFLDRTRNTEKLDFIFVVAVMIAKDKFISRFQILALHNSTTGDIWTTEKQKWKKFSLPNFPTHEKSERNLTLASSYRGRGSSRAFENYNARHQTTSFSLKTMGLESISFRTPTPLLGRSHGDPESRLVFLSRSTRQPNIFWLEDMVDSSRRSKLFGVFVAICIMGSMGVTNILKWIEHEAMVGRANHRIALSSSSIQWKGASKQYPILKKEDPHPGRDMKILIYMTTHLSEQHQQFLTCWEDAIPRFQLLHNADLMLYTSEIPNDKILKQLSGFKNVTVKMSEKRHKQAGAIKAMIDPWEQGWFKAYDWVIRLNPDVLIRNETWLLDTMMNALDNDDKSGPVALAVFCHAWKKLHTDFIAFRPNLMVFDDFLNETVNHRDNAEMHMTRALARFSEQGRVEFIPGFVQKPACRVMGPKAPIIHHHDLATFCPDYYDKTNNESY